MNTPKHTTHIVHLSHLDMYRVYCDQGCDLRLPEIVVLCGSTRFVEAFAEANQRLTHQGKIVLTVGSFVRWQDEPDPEAAYAELQSVKAMLDALHKRKIDLADRALILNVGGYIGETTRDEIAYAFHRGIPIEFLEPLAPGEPAT